MVANQLVLCPESREIAVVRDYPAVENGGWAAGMGSAHVYFRTRDVVVHSQHLTTAGVWIAGLPAIRIQREGLTTRLVDAVQEAVAKSSEGVLHPTDWKGVGGPVLQAAGVRSWSALARGSRLCGVTDSDGAIVVVPYRNGGTTGDGRGFHELLGREIRVSTLATADDLLAALLRAEELCEV